MAGEALSPCTKNTAGILREAIRLPAKNPNLMLRVFLLVLSPFSLLVLLHYLVAGPLIRIVEDAYETSSLERKDVGTLIVTEFPFFLVFCIISLFATSITVRSSALAYTGKSTNLKELVLWTGSNWKKPLITSMHVSILTLSYSFICVISLRLASLIVTENASYLFNWLLGIFAASFYLYLASVWNLGFVISIVEADCFGPNAIGKARRLIRGRGVQGFSLMLILALLSIPIYVLFYVTTTDDDGELGNVTRFAFIFVATVLFCFTNLFAFMVFTVFHLECKRSHGENLETGSGHGYLLVSTVIDPAT